jgi:hypothetical protein
MQRLPHFPVYNNRDAKDAKVRRYIKKTDAAAVTEARMTRYLVRFAVASPTWQL